MHFKDCVYTNVQQYGGKFLVRGFTKNGQRFATKDKTYRPYLFTPTKQETGFETLYGTPLKKIKFSNPYEAKQALKKYEDVENAAVYYGMDQFVYPFISDKFSELDESDIDLSRIKVVDLDIETTARDGFPNINNPTDAVTALTLLYGDKAYFFSYKKYETDDPNVKPILCRDEEDLLRKFLKFWDSAAFSPDVVTGWYVKYFDIPYLVNRIVSLLGEDFARMMSPWRLLKESSVFVNGRENTVYSPLGISVLDYIDLYKKFTFKNRESYALNFICEVELEEKKLDYSEYSSLDELYEKDFKKYADYNIHDCRLVRKLDDKLRLLELAFTMAYSSGINFEDVFGSIRVWDVTIYNYLIKQGIVVPPKKSDQIETTKPVGGYVKQPVPGAYDWIVTFDLTSLYPHLIIQYNISPETKAGKYSLAVFNNPDAFEQELPNMLSELEKMNRCVTANGVMYEKNRRGFLPQLMENFFAKRKYYKDEMKRLKKEDADENTIKKYDVFQLATKIQLNSAYGALANLYFRWFDYDLAQSITYSGQFAIKYTETQFNKWFSRYLGRDDVKDYVVALDTDSIIVDFNDYVKTLDETDPQKIKERISDFFEEEIRPFFEKMYSEFAEPMNAYKQALVMKREKICDRGIFFVKKNYALSIIDDEGEPFDPPKVDITGGDAVKSSTPKMCREALKECMTTILQGTEDDLIGYVKEFQEEFLNKSYEDISFTSSVRDLRKYTPRDGVYAKGSPIQVRASLLYNDLLKKEGIKKEPIYDGDKVKYVYLSLPNPIGENVVAFKDSSVLSNLYMGDYIDYDKMIEKSFLKPLRSICSVAGWEYERTNKVYAFFED